MTFIVAIAGGSCVGKTTIARALLDTLKTDGIGGGALVAEDDYYICRTTIPGFDPRTHDFDAPAAKDHALLSQHLALARKGQAFEKPRYDFATHSRMPVGEIVPLTDVLVIEGLHAFATDALRAGVDLAVYLEADEALRRARRVARDVAARARTPGFVEAQWDGSVRPGHARWVAPQKAHADLVLVCEGGDPGAHARTIAAAIAARR
jgi:uridine kinase